MKQLLVLLLLLCSMSVSAQDVIVKKDGSTVVCRVVEVTATEITYKKWSDLNGSKYVMDKSLASAINYESGKKETFGQTESLYKPNNQNDGEQAMNDRALLQLDASMVDYPQKAKNLKKIGWIVGGALFTAGVIVSSCSGEDGGPIAGPLVCGGIICTTTCLLVAGHYKRKASKLNAISLYQKEFKLKNGSSLLAGIDMLRDCTASNHTVGLGLRYNF